MSPSKLRRNSLFYLGVPPSQYVMFLRLRHAIRLLKLYPSKTIADVAEQSGFCDHAHFTHTFIRYLEQTPYDYSHEVITPLKKAQVEPTE
ncbi:MAG: helix-turn-helix domain-containing protein [Bacteroidales bacterium]|nr:helix-turn-helix domain-containing protein [Bacteroidales bacterium]